MCSLEECVGVLDRIAAKVALVDRGQPGTGGHRLGDLLGVITVLDDAAGQQADEPALIVHDGEGLEAEMPLLDHREDVADREGGRGP